MSEKPNGKELQEPQDEEFLDVDKWLEESDVRYHTVNVPGGKLRLGSLTAGDLLEWAEEKDPIKKRTQGLRILAKSFVDKNGKRISAGNGEVVVKKLLDKDSKVCNELVEEVLVLNGLRIREEDIKKAIDEAKSGASPIVLH